MLKNSGHKTISQKLTNRARTMMPSFATQVWAAGDLDSNLGSVSAFLEEVGMTMMVVVNNNNYLNRRASSLFCRKGHLGSER